MKIKLILSFSLCSENRCVLVKISIQARKTSNTIENDYQVLLGTWTKTRFTLSLTSWILSQFTFCSTLHTSTNFFFISFSLLFFFNLILLQNQAVYSDPIKKDSKIAILTSLYWNLAAKINKPTAFSLNPLGKQKKELIQQSLFPGDFYWIYLIFASNWLKQ